MTLILGMANKNFIVQVADRRFTSVGRPPSDEQPKSIIVTCSDARLVVGYTGLATAGNYMTQRFLLDTLTDAPEGMVSVEPLINHLAEGLTRKFKSIRATKSEKRLTVLFTGYQYLPDDQYALLITTLTNFELMDEDRRLPEALGEFRAYTRSYLEADPAFLDAIGAKEAITTSDFESLRALIRGRPPEAVAGKAIEVLRNAADSPRAHGTIGKQLMVVTLPSALDSAAAAHYESVDAGHKVYMCDEVRMSTNGNLALMGGAVWADDPATTPPMAIPRTPANRPCPCRSGYRYKHCHGNWGKSKGYLWWTSEAPKHRDDQDPSL